MAIFSACLVLGLMLVSSACVLPLQFEEQVDAGTSADDNAPAINLTTTQPSMITSTIIERAAPPQFELHLEDKDLEDTLYVRIFRDYQASPDPARTELTIGPTGTLERVKSFSTIGWCPTDATPGTSFLFEVLVSDRAFLEDGEPGQPLYRGLPAGAKTARSYWVGVCQ